MNGRTGLIAVLIVFALLLFVVISMRGGEKQVGVKELKIEKIDKDKVTKIEVALPPKKGEDGQPSEAAKKVVLEKDGTAWKVYDPAAPDKKFAADDGQVKSALEAVGEFSTGDLIANKKEKLAEFEIDDDKGHGVKLYTGKEVALDLVFGRPAKSGGSTVRARGSDDVYVAKGRLGAVLKKEVAGWRKKAIVDAKADDFTQISTKLEDGTSFTVSAAAAPAPESEEAAPPRPEWQLTEPATLPAGFRLDKNALSRPASQLAALRAQDFADTTSDADAGLDKPNTIVEATMKDGKKIVLRIGKEDDKKRVFAKIDGDPQTYLLAQYTAKQFQKKLDDFRDLTLFDAKPEEVERVTFRGSGGTFTVKKDGSGWKLIEPKTAPAEFDASQIATQVSSVLRTRGTRVANVGAKESGLEKPSPVVELTFTSGKKQSLRFGAPLPIEGVDGKPPEKDAKPREYYVKGGLDDLTYVVAAFTRNRFDKPADLFKKPPEPPPMAKGPGGIPGMENLPPDVRKKLEESLKRGDFSHP
jgi:hypothetical protein